VLVSSYLSALFWDFFLVITFYGTEHLSLLYLRPCIRAVFGKDVAWWRGRRGVKSIKGSIYTLYKPSFYQSDATGVASVELPSPQPTNHPRHRPLYWGRNNHSFIYSLAMLSESFDISWAYIILLYILSLDAIFFTANVQLYTLKRTRCVSASVCSLEYKYCDIL